jgi:hypothetical protein
VNYQGSRTREGGLSGFTFCVGPHTETLQLSNGPLPRAATTRRERIKVARSYYIFAQEQHLHSYLEDTVIDFFFFGKKNDKASDKATTKEQSLVQDWSHRAVAQLRLSQLLRITRIAGQLLGKGHIGTEKVMILYKHQSINDHVCAPYLHLVFASHSFHPIPSFLVDNI